MMSIVMSITVHGQQSVVYKTVDSLVWFVRCRKCIRYLEQGKVYVCLRRTSLVEEPRIGFRPRGNGIYPKRSFLPSLLLSLLLSLFTDNSRFVHGS